MLKIERTENGLVVTGPNGNQILIKERGKGYKFLDQWWPEDKAHEMMCAVEMKLNAQSKN